MTPSAPAVTSLVRYTTCGGMDYPLASEGRSGRRPSGMTSISHQVRFFGLVFAVYIPSCTELGFYSASINTQYSVYKHTRGWKGRNHTRT